MSSSLVSLCGPQFLVIEVKAAKILPTIPTKNQRGRMPIGRPEHKKLCSVLVLTCIIKSAPGNLWVRDPFPGRGEGEQISMAKTKYLTNIFGCSVFLQNCHKTPVALLLKITLNAYNIFVFLGICRDHGKAYAVYLITVTKTNSDGSEDVWDVYRRYSDFHDLHSTILERVGYIKEIG